MGKYIFSFGIIASVIIIGLLFLTVLLWDGSFETYKSVQWIGQVGILVGLATMYFAIKRFRDNEQNGFLSMATGFKLGLFITIVVSVLYVGSWTTYMVSGGNPPTEAVFEQASSQMNTQGHSDRNIKAQKRMMSGMSNMFSTPLAQAILAFFEVFPAGLLVALMCALILKKEREGHYVGNEY